MKKVSLFLFLIMLSKLITAQDTIVKINGDVISAKIIEINPSQIKYKKPTFLDGPTYVENKSEVKYIKYSTGLKEEFTGTQKPKAVPEASTNIDYYNPNEGPLMNSNKMQYAGGASYKFENRIISEREMQNILMRTNNKRIVSQIQIAKDAHIIQFAGFGAIPLGIGALYFLSRSFSYNGNPGGSLAASALMLGGAITCPIVSGIYKHKRVMSNRAAVELYNQTY